MDRPCTHSPGCHRETAVHAQKHRRCLQIPSAASPEALGSHTDVLTSGQKACNALTLGCAGPTALRQRRDTSRRFTASWPRPACSRNPGRSVPGPRPTCGHQLLQQAAPLVAEDVGAREAAVAADDAQVGDAALHQVVSRRPPALPSGEGLAARTADDGAALHR